MSGNRFLLAAVSLVAVAAIGVASPAMADVIYNLDANLDPFQEVPPHNTPAYGSADTTLDFTTGVFMITAGTGLYADLLAGATTVRLQDAAVGANGPTISLLNLDTPGNTSGTFSGAASAPLTMAQMTDMLAGNTYINIADSVFPSGEIRGQLQVAPEPSSLVLAGLAALGLLAAARRRTRCEA
jgi:MYXO-CTERM domain-containing protein